LILFVAAEIQPICLAPATESTHVGDTLLVSGWGKTADGVLQGISDVLMKVTAPGITTAECAATYGDIITDNILCIDTTGGKGSCNVIIIFEFPSQNFGTLRLKIDLIYI
jgi:hypothetical protein